MFLEDVRPKEADSDLPLWRWDSKGVFTVTSTYCHFVDGGLRLRNTRYIWRSKCPLKVCFFIWLLAKNANFTSANQMKRGRIRPSMCVLCKNSGEDNQHLMLNYTFSAIVELKSASLFELHIDMSVGSEIWARLRVCKENHRFITMVVSANC